MYDLSLLVFKHRFKFQDSVYNSCHVFTVLSLNISNINITTIKNIDYRSIIDNISKSEAINLSKNYVLEKCGYI